MSKKIVFAIDTNSAGGGERVIATLANYFGAKGYETYLINSDSSSAFYPISPSVTVVKMGLDRGKSGRIRRVLKKYYFLKRFLKEKKPDVLIPFLFNMEAPAILAGLRTKTNVVTSVRNASKAYSKRERRFRRFFYPKIFGVVFQSKVVQQYEDFSHLRNTTVIMNPMVNEITEPMIPVPYCNRRNVVISVARLEPQKNHEMTIRAFAMICEEFPGLELHIFGEGSLRNHLEKLIEELNIKGRVFLEGAVAEATLKNRDAKLFVMASNFEGFPNALAEAMAYGIPSISTDFDTGVASDLIEEGQNGWLVKVGDTMGLADKMRLVLNLQEKTDEVAEDCAKVFFRLRSDVICAQWENFLFPTGE